MAIPVDNNAIGGHRMRNTKLMLSIFVAILGAMIFINYLGSFTVSVNVFDLELTTKLLKPGNTIVNIPPFGRIIAKTHKLPVQLNITLINIKPNLIKDLLSNSFKQNELVAELKHEAQKAIKIYILKLLLLSFAGAAFFGMVFRYNIKYIILIGLMSLIVFISIGGYVYNSYNYDAFIDPKYEGILEAAPWMMGIARQTLPQIDKLGEQMQVITRNAYTLLTKINDIRPIDKEGQVLILHISDLHNNPAAFDFIEETVKSFNVDIIVDTGDITDFGTPLEIGLIKRINELKIPYIFIPGNHDSPAVLAAMKSQKNVVVLNDGYINLKGITIYGIGDPAAASISTEIPADVNLDEYSLAKKQGLINNSIEPDIVAAHNIKTAQHFADIAPTILIGHNHALKVEKIGDTVLVNAGTTGAAGIRGFQSKEDLPYSEVLLYLNPDAGRHEKFIAADIIKIYSLSQKGLTLERFLNQ